MPDFSATVQVIRRSFKNFMGFIDTGSIYVPVTKTDPGPDGKAGTEDDGGAVTVFNLTNPGHEFKLFTNPPNATRDYSAFQIIGTKRYSHNWQASLSYTWSHTHGTVDNRFGSNSGGGGTYGLGQTGAFADPNHFINADGDATLDYTNQVKLDGTYRVPLFGGLAQGSETIRIESRSTRRTDPINNFDLRVEKTFPIGSASRQAGVYLDVFNVNNQGVIDAGSSTGVIDSSSSTFGNPNRWISPRLLRLGFRFSW